MSAIQGTSNFGLLALAVNVTAGVSFSNSPVSAGEFLKPQISTLTLHIDVVNSAVGILPAVAVAILDPIVQAFLDLVRGAFNNFFPGFPLPTTKGVAISNVLITTAGGYLGVGLDIDPILPCFTAADGECTSDANCCAGLTCQAWSYDGVPSGGKICLPPKPTCNQEFGFCGGIFPTPCCDGFKCLQGTGPGFPKCVPLPANCTSMGNICTALPCCPGSECQIIKGTSISACCLPGTECVRQSLAAEVKEQLGLAAEEKKEELGRAAEEKEEEDAMQEGGLGRLPPGFSGPGLEATVGGPALTKMLKAVVRAVSKKINSITIPEQVCHLESCGLGGGKNPVQYDIKAIPIRRFSIANPAISFVTGQGLVLSLGGIYFNLHPTDFVFKKPVLGQKPKCPGTFTASLTDVTIKVVANITADSNGQPKMTATSTVDWGAGLQVDAYLRGFCKAIKNIIQFFIGNVNALLVKLIEELVPPALNDAVNQLGNELLSGLDLEKKIDQYASVNYYLTQNPVSAYNRISLYFAGQVVKT
mmetsp:Transcript_11580/g.22034  ORF Transcript_11580/g.22034 Transcript_11580/m.22034 type:complete len:531 (+) Transcript_11580:475-2067(+)